MGYTLWQHPNCSSTIHYICHLPSASGGNYVITGEKNLILITIQSEDASITQSALACSKVLISSQIGEPMLQSGNDSLYIY